MKIRHPALIGVAGLGIAWAVRLWVGGTVRYRCHALDAGADPLLAGADAAVPLLVLARDAADAGVAVPADADGRPHQRPRRRRDDRPGDASASAWA